MLATQLNHLIADGKLENFTIIRVKKFVVNKVATKATTGKEQKKIIILLDVEPVVPGSEVCLLRMIEINVGPSFISNEITFLRLERKLEILRH